MRRSLYLVRLSGGNGGDRVARDFARSGLGKAWHNDHVLEAGDRTDALADFRDHLFHQLRSIDLRV